MWKNSRPIFKDVVWDMFRARQQHKKDGNSVMSECVKLMMNSLYGKLIQRLITSKKRWCNSNDEYMKLFAENKIGKTIDLMQGEGSIKLLVDQIMDEDNCTAKELNKLIKKCPYLGVFVLAYSKKIMNYARECFDGHKHFADFYQDTDSFYVRHSDYEKLRLDNDKYRESPFYDDLGNRLTWVNPHEDPDEAVLTQS